MNKEIARARAADLISQMTLEEKISQMRHEAPAIPRLNIPAYNWWNECLHGVGRAGTATVFPQPIGMAAAFDAEMMREIGTVISDEARAKHHESARRGERGIYHGLTFWTPNINIFRDPRWGRGHETYGEDPFLTARLAVPFIRALQGEDDACDTVKVAATAKHFAVHSGPESLRHSFDAQPSLKDLRETYLPAFEAAVKEGRVEAVMGAYNRVFGEACCGSPMLLQEILRDEWGFDGHVVSDCGAICDIDNHHKLKDTRAESAAYAVKGGCDLNCGNAYEHLLVAVREGLLSEQDIDRAVIRLFELRYRLGMFDETPSVYANIPYEIVDCDAHRELSREAAEKSAVLVKNDGALPLNPSMRAVAVIGPSAQDADLLLGNYSGRSARPVTLLQGVQNAVSSMTRVYYGHGSEYAKTRGKFEESGLLAEAAALSERADATILCLGLNPDMEGEEGDAYNGEPVGDRVNIELPAIQKELFDVVMRSGKPVVVLLTGGSAIAAPELLARANAVMQVWYPGGEGGTAVANLLFGKKNPSGRMPITVYASTDELPDFEDYSMKNRTYRYYDGVPLIPFGFGLSYSTFGYSRLMAPARVSEGQDLTFNVMVMNHSDRAGDTVVQAYLSGKGMSAIRKLCAFARVSLHAHESKTVELTIRAERLREIDEDGVSKWKTGVYTLDAGGSQPDARSMELGAAACASRNVEFV